MYVLYCTVHVFLCIRNDLFSTCNLECIFLFRSAETKDWSIVELQGFLESDQPDLSGLKIGDLHFDARVSSIVLVTIVISYQGFYTSTDMLMSGKLNIIRPYKSRLIFGG